MIYSLQVSALNISTEIHLLENPIYYGIKTMMTHAFMKTYSGSTLQHVKIRKSSGLNSSSCSYILISVLFFFWIIFSLLLLYLFFLDGDFISVDMYTWYKLK